MKTFLKRIFSYIKIGLFSILNRKIQAADYSLDYNRVAQTYGRWTGKMGKHADPLLSILAEYEKPVLNILDFCCGTGDITQKILSAYPEQQGWRVTGVDISSQMIQHCRDTIRDSRALFVEAEGSRFLKQAGTAAFDLIFCGWGLVYFKPVQVIKQFQRILKNQGAACAIMNRKGTLAGIEEIFLEIMAETPQQIRKIMDIRYSLPGGLKQFTRWFTQHGFSVMAAGEGEEFFTYAAPEELLSWLEETGAIAGTSGIMACSSDESSRRLRESILSKIADKLKTSDGYRINHKFVYGNFKKGSVKRY